MTLDSTCKMDTFCNNTQKVQMILLIEFDLVLFEKAVWKL